MPRAMTSPRTAAIATIAAALLLATASSATAIAWNLPAQVVSGAGQDADSPEVAALRDGGALAVYRTRSGVGDVRRIAARRIGPDGTFGAERILTPPSAAETFQPQATATPDGGAFVTWSREDDDPGTADARIEAMRVGPDATPGPVIQVTGDQQVAFGATVAVAPDGTATVAWLQGPAIDAMSVVARRVPAVGAPGPLLEVSPPGANTGVPRIAVAPDGTVTVAWHVGFGPGEDVFARRIAPSGALGSTIDIPDDPARIPVDVGVAPGPGGSTHLAWIEDAGVGRVFHVVIGPTGTVGPAVEVTDEPGPGPIEVGELRVSAARDGSAVVAWLRQPTLGRTLAARRVAPDGTRGPVRFLSDLGSSASDPVLAASPDGSTLAVWRFGNGVSSVAQARRMRADDTLGDVQVISPQSAVPSADRQVGDELGLAAMRDGRAVAVWDVFAPGSPDPNPGQVQAAISAPTLFVPGPPLGVGAAAGDASATVSWSAPVSDGGLPITAFTATASPGGASCTTAATTCTIGGLQNGVAHTVTVTATNGLGTGAPSQVSAPFTPLAPVAPVPPPPALRLTGVRVTPAVVVRGRPARTTRLLRVRATLNRPAALRVVFERRAPGLRRGRACVAPTRALRRARARACVRFVPSGVVRRAGRAGVNTITITRLRVAGRALAVGRYRVTVIAAVPGSPPRRASRPLTVRPAR